jgi:hypothetical protein
MNHGLPPSLAATDPSLNYHTKGLDMATAAYASELGYLGSPVLTHIQSAESYPLSCTPGFTKPPHMSLLIVGSFGHGIFGTTRFRSRAPQCMAYSLSCEYHVVARESCEMEADLYTYILNSCTPGFTKPPQVQSLNISPRQRVIPKHMEDSNT